MFHTESDVVFVKGLTVEAVIGVYAWERAITQPLLIDIALETDISKAAVSDDVHDALNYKAVCDDVSEWCKEIQAKLLEHLAGQISDKIFAKYDCQKITLSIAKPTAIAQADAVGVQITRYAPASTDELATKEDAKEVNVSQADDA
ncbi:MULTISPECIES: dihydroneopterin aldolase [Psychrobacter]|uniref:dihydroneopterin aldolase n=1 Tax=Psychrobacter TaxID=497 RepID=UPI00191A5A56|nr:MULTISPECIES: dihydroneopterin aldolase [Psychrobacter]